MQKWSNFESEVGKSEIDGIIKNSKGLRHKSNWSDRAKQVGIEDQYNFMYSYTSRLLHACPFSFYTNQKNLEYREIETFLEFTYVSLLDIIELGKKKIRDGAGTS